MSPQAALACTLAFAPAFTQAQNSPTLPAQSATRVLVRLSPNAPRDGTGPIGVDGIDVLLARRRIDLARPVFPTEPMDVALADQYSLRRWWLIECPAGNAADIAADLRNLPGLVDLAEPDGVGGPAEVIPNDPLFGLQWGLHNTGQVVPNLGAGLPGADISALEAWEIDIPQRGLILAVIDAGVDHHAELEGRIVPGWSAIEGSSDTTDQCDHGTHVAGIAAARGDNAVGIAGLCWWAAVQPVRVIESDCSGYESQAAAGIVWAADHGASIANISLQYYSGTQVLADAVEYAHARGLLMIAAAGNSNGAKVAYPAKFPHTIAVSATDNQDRLATWSNHGPEIDVAAPGHTIHSLLDLDAYKYASGTSMAAPMVSGLACLIWARNPSLTADEVADIITSSAHDLGDAGWDESFGRGRINAAAALATTPCYADLDRDGRVGLSDFLAFQNAFVAGDPAADCDRTSGAGALDLFDYMCFHNAFMQGCP